LDASGNQKEEEDVATKKVITKGGGGGGDGGCHRAAGAGLAGRTEASEASREEEGVRYNGLVWNGERPKRGTRKALAKKIVKGSERKKVAGSRALWEARGEGQEEARMSGNGEFRSPGWGGKSGKIMPISQ